MKNTIYLLWPLTLILLRIPLPSKPNMLIQKNSLLSLLKIILSWHLSILKEDSVVWGPEKKYLFTIFTLSLNFSSTEQSLTPTFEYYIWSSLGRTSSWPSAGEIWASTSSFDLSANSSTMVPAMSSVPNSWQINRSTRGQDSPQWKRPKMSGTWRDV